MVLAGENATTEKGPLELRAAVRPVGPDVRLGTPLELALGDSTENRRFIGQRPDDTPLSRNPGCPLHGTDAGCPPDAGNSPCSGRKCR